MASEPVILRNDAELHFSESFDQLRGFLPGDAKVEHRRANAIEYFRRTGLPHRRVEAWHYTDLRALLRKVPRIGIDSVDATLARLLADDPLAHLGHARLVVADGAYRPDLSEAKGLSGVEVASLAEALKRGDARIGSLFHDNADATLALNTAFVIGGVLLRIDAGATVSRPIRIMHLQTAAEPQSANVRNVIDVGAAATVEIWESHGGVAGVGHHANVVTEFLVGGRAKVKAARLQSADLKAFHITSLFASIADGASFDHAAVTIGAGLSRAQASFKLVGEGARLGLSGATMLDGDQHADTAIVIEHAAPHTTSRVLYRSVADGQSFGAFQGKIIVAEGAQKSDGKLGSKALLLSDGAGFSAKPELEIYADDVQCGHGSTTGKIDANHLFYLLSRGIPRAEAERLLVSGFLTEAIESLGDERLLAALIPGVEAWLAARGQTGGG